MVNIMKAFIFCMLLKVTTGCCLLAYIVISSENKVKRNWSMVLSNSAIQSQFYYSYTYVATLTSIPASTWHVNW